MLHMKSVFIGHFSPAANFGEPAVSVAGNQVQRQIVRELENQTDVEAVSYAMTPVPAWPLGAIIVRSQRENSVEFIGYLNFPMLKHLIFSFRLLVRLIGVKPELCLQYNSYFFENLALLLFRLLKPSCYLAIIIQDVHAERETFNFSRRDLRALSERLSLLLARSFDLVVAISSSIITDFRLDPRRSFVFQGGITDCASKLILEHQDQIGEIGVFAGALEPHNGIDLLVDKWLSSEMVQTLHVFGRGSLQSYVQQASNRSKKIIFHGLQPENVIIQWQLKARWNFCLRYSKGINQKYFFPSKFFNIVCAPGITVVNDFNGLPEALRNYTCVLADDLSCLKERLLDSKLSWNLDLLNKRREIVMADHSWHSCVQKIISLYHSANK